LPVSGDRDGDTSPSHAPLRNDDEAGEDDDDGVTGARGGAPSSPIRIPTLITPTPGSLLALISDGDRGRLRLSLLLLLSTPLPPPLLLSLLLLLLLLLEDVVVEGDTTRAGGSDASVSCD
jgi:hypothetical protein